MYINLGDWSIRNYVDDDEVALVKYANNYKIWVNVDDIFPYPYTKNDAKNWIESTKQLPQTNFAIASPKEAIGGIGLKLKANIYKGSAEVGYWLGEPYWGQGHCYQSSRYPRRICVYQLRFGKAFSDCFRMEPSFCTRSSEKRV